MLTSNQTKLLLASACAWALGCATTTPAYSSVTTETRTATVEAVNLATRVVTLKLESGEHLTFVAGDRIKNLDQMRIGDHVIAQYTEAIAIEVRPADGSAPAMEVHESSGGAPKGEKPAGGYTREVLVSASIEAIDREKLKVTVKGPEGKLRTLQVKDPAKLTNVKVGDMVDVSYAQSVGISVQRLPPGESPPN